MSTFDALATVRVGAGGAATIQFTAIPGTYTDLIVKLSSRSTASALSDNVLIRPNGSAANLSSRNIQGNQTAVTSATATDASFAINGATSLANTFGMAELRIQQYAAAVQKPMNVQAMTEHNSTGAILLQLVAVAFADTTAITSLTLATVTGIFAQNTEATLYGVKNA